MSHVTCAVHRQNRQQLAAQCIRQHNRILCAAGQTLAAIYAAATLPKEPALKVIKFLTDSADQTQPCIISSWHKAANRLILIQHT
jgi:hypothetical protein